MPDSPRKILIVDDEPDVVVYLTALLQDNGFEVITAASGKEGFSRATSEQPDLITLDITMPEETGLSLLQDLHESTVTKHIPVIIITGTPGEFNGNGSNPEPAGYFEKPIDREELLAKISSILK